MKYYNRSCATTQDSIFVRGRRAGLLLQQKDVDGALAELRILKNLAPARAEIHIMLGRLYSKKLDKTSALQCYVTALALNPSVSLYVRYPKAVLITGLQASASIKEEIEALESEEVGTTDMSWS